MRPYLDTMDIDDRLDQLGCRALVVLARSSRDPYLAPFLRPVRLHESLLIVPRGRALRLGFMTPMERGEASASGLDLLTPEALDVERWNRDGAAPHELLGNVVSRALHLCEVAPGPVALAGQVEAGRLQAACELLAGEGWSFVPGEATVEALRRHKSPQQLDTVRRVAAGTCEVFRHVAGLLAAAATVDGQLWLGGERLTVQRLRREIASAFHERALEEPEGNIVAPGEEGAIPHSTGTDERVLQPGESLIIDLFPRESAPWATLFADCTRTFCVGEPPDVLREAHGHVRAALDLAHRQTRPGVRGWNLQQAVCEQLSDAGYPTPISDPGTTRGYVHGLGHGVGFEVHEAPSFREFVDDDEGVLETGDVVTLEPGLYDPEAGWAVRLEDLVIVGEYSDESGVENLTPLPYDLDPRAW